MENPNTPAEDQPAPQVNPENKASGPSSVAGRDIVSGTVINVAAGGTVVIGARAGQGLQALQEMVQVSPEVHAAVAVFSASFQSSTLQVDIMGDYKELHDLLHQIQYQCYSTIVREAARFPDESALEVLCEYTLNLRDILAGLQSVTAHAHIQPSDSLWINEIATSAAELRAATENLDAASLKNAVTRIKHVISTQPVRINMRLINAAQMLSLPMLLQALDQVRMGLVDLPIDTDRLERFRDGLLALKSMNERLQALLIAHEAWQNLDFELRQVENMLEKDLGELDFSWQMIKDQAAPLYTDITEEWAVTLNKYRQALDDALPTKNPPKIRQAFRNFRHEVGSRFYFIDLNLKALCGDLRLVGEPLAAIVRQL